MPYAIGAVTADGTVDEWHNAFYIGLAVSVFGCLEFLIFGSGEEQKWLKKITMKIHHLMSNFYFEILSDIFFVAQVGRDFAFEGVSLGCRYSDHWET